MIKTRRSKKGKRRPTEIKWKDETKKPIFWVLEVECFIPRNPVTERRQFKKFFGGEKKKKNGEKEENVEIWREINEISF